MAGSFSVTIASLSAINIGGSKRSEVLVIEEIVRRYLQVMSSSHATSITMKDLSGNTAGTMTWTPANTT
jgi:hypothetical protein